MPKSKKLSRSVESKEEFMDLLPSTPKPDYLLAAKSPPLLGGEIKETPTEDVLKHDWFNGIRIKKDDLAKITQLQDIKGAPVSTFNYEDHCRWATEVAQNTVVCNVDAQFNIGVELYVPLGRTLKKGTFIPATGVLDFTLEGLSTKFHASSFSNPHSDL